jgi:adenosylhomocysteine nucleosidase
MARRAKSQETPPVDASAPILVITGLAREAACLSGDGLEPLLSGADPTRLRAALQSRETAPYAFIVSFGLAGGLDPELSPGDFVLPETVVAGPARVQTHARSLPLLREALDGAAVFGGALAGADAPIMTLRDKASLRAATGAAAVDMESHIAGEFAARRGLPFLVMRVVSDPATRALPPLAAKAVTPEGGVDLGLVMRELARQPGQLADLVRAGADAGKAFASLRRGGPLIGPLLRLVLSGL